MAGHIWPIGSRLPVPDNGDYGDNDNKGEKGWWGAAGAGGKQNLRLPEMFKYYTILVHQGLVDCYTKHMVCFLVVQSFESPEMNLEIS